MWTRPLHYRLVCIYRCGADVALLRDPSRDGDGRRSSARPETAAETRWTQSHVGVRSDGGEWYLQACSDPAGQRSRLHCGLWVSWPDSVLEAGQEAGGDAESGVQEVLFIWRLQSLQVCVKLLWKVKGHVSSSVTVRGWQWWRCWCLPSLRPEARVSKWFFREFLSSSSSKPKLPTELPWLRESVSETERAELVMTRDGKQRKVRLLSLILKGLIVQLTCCNRLDAFILKIWQN